MIDLKMTGYTTEKYSVQLNPDIVSIKEDPKSSVQFQCKTGRSPDERLGALCIDITVDTKTSDDEPFVSVNGVFYFSFEAEKKCSWKSMDKSLQTIGLQTALPVIRGIMVGIGKTLNLPDVFSFPPIDSSAIQWSDSEQ